MLHYCYRNLAKESIHCTKNMYLVASKSQTSLLATFSNKAIAFILSQDAVNKENRKSGTGNGHLQDHFFDLPLPY